MPKNLFKNFDSQLIIWEILMLNVDSKIVFNIFKFRIQVYKRQCPDKIRIFEYIDFAVIKGVNSGWGQGGSAPNQICKGGLSPPRRIQTYPLFKSETEE